MSALLLALVLAAPAAASDCGAPLDDLLDQVLQSSDEDAYLCLAEREEAGAFLVEAVEARGAAEVETQLSRALAIHLLQRLGRAITAPESRALNGADRRFLRDGVHARRGRRSPIPMNDKVFRKFSWYQPDKSYTPGRLTDLDRANLSMIDKPPEAPKAAKGEGAAAAVAEAQAAAPAEATETCGCAAATGGGALWWGMLGGLGILRRRRSH